MQLRTDPKSSGHSAFTLMFIREVKTKLDVIFGHSQQKRKYKQDYFTTRKFQVEDRVQAIILHEVISGVLEELLRKKVKCKLLRK